MIAESSPVGLLLRVLNIIWSVSLEPIDKIKLIKIPNFRKISSTLIEGNYIAWYNLKKEMMALLKILTQNIWNWQHDAKKWTKL